MKDMRVADLSPVQRRCVTLFRSISFGRIEGLVVQGGDAILDPPPTVVRTIKLNEPPAAAGTVDNFVLKTELVQFFVAVRALGKGIVRRIEIRHGLPILMEVEQAAVHPFQERSDAPALLAVSGGLND